MDISHKLMWPLKQSSYHCIYIYIIGPKDILKDIWKQIANITFHCKYCHIYLTILSQCHTSLKKCNTDTLELLIWGSIFKFPLLSQTCHLQMINYKNIEDVSLCKHRTTSKMWETYWFKEVNEIPVQSLSNY